ncbi:hypothetical protein KEM60_03324 [Austwickia sp. TVS 96-490-7B]|uniref:hypothetical protein n=1 Tax=Austwickia sp. TVS 96-490-7B TaxID=2830843 RepID=UPI001C56652A|nr:hypothetical protein [Austwickia sp. TVS 96-490-7B]MBW3087094.1 hypothetical protein [Austwickia sp. TVS 96-490-7B]
MISSWAWCFYSMWGNRFIAGSGLSQVGSWVSLLAIIVILQKEYGSASVVWLFLLRTAGPALLSRTVTRMLKRCEPGSAWAAAQGLLCFLQLSLFIIPINIATILVITGISCVIQGCANTWMMSCVTCTLTGGDRERTIRAMRTSAHVALVAGPALGAYIQGHYGLRAVFIFDALTFLAALMLLPWRLSAALWSPGQRDKGGPRWVIGAPASLRGCGWLADLRYGWLTFGVFTGLLNCVEMPVLVSQRHLSTTEVALTISFFGVGGLCFFVQSLMGLSVGPAWLHALGSAVAFMGWASVEGLASSFLFAVLGYMLAAAGSGIEVRAAMMFSEITGDPSDLWAWFFQLGFYVSLLTYLAGLMYFYVWASPTFLIVLATVAIVLCVVFLHRLVRSSESDHVRLRP